MSAVHHKRLVAGYQHFSEWCAVRRINLQDVLADIPSISGLLAHFVQHCRDNQMAIHVARFAVLGVSNFHRELHGRLKRPWDAISAWQHEQPARNRTPLPEALMFGLVLEFVFGGLRPGPASEELWAAAVCVRLGFNALLRPAELLKLTVADLSIPLAYQPGPLIIALRDPKNRWHAGRNQFRTVEDKGVINWIRWYVEGVPGHYRLWPKGERAFRKVWDWGLQQLQVQTLQLTPASMRGGGATYLYLANRSIPDIKFRGGWVSDKSLAIYIQEAMATLVWRAIPRAQLEALSARVASHTSLFEAAPHRSWQTLFQRRLQLCPSNSS